MVTTEQVLLFSYLVSMLLCMTTCHMHEVWQKLEIKNGRQEAVWALKRCTFVFALDSTHMDGFFRNLVCRLGYVIMEDENRVTKSKKFPPKNKKIKIKFHNLFFLFFTFFTCWLLCTKMNRFVFVLCAANMDGFFWNLVCRLIWVWHSGEYRVAEK